MWICAFLSLQIANWEANVKLLKLSEFRKFTGGNLVEQEKSKSKLSFDPVPKNQVQREYEIATLLSQITLIAVRFPIMSAPIDSRIQ